MTSHLKRPEPTAFCCTGPLVSYIEDFAASLIREGYAPLTLKEKYELAADLSGWLARRRLPLAALDEKRMKEFYAQRHRGRRRGDARTEQQLLALLRARRAVPAITARIKPNAIDELTEGYAGSLRNERGVSEATLVSYLPIVRRFLASSFAGREASISDLQASDLHRFILRETRRVGTRHAYKVMGVLRSFMRFLKERGTIRLDLSAAITASPIRSVARLPKTLAPKEVQQLLAGCDRRTSGGRRDYAMLLLLARLGLRGGEVINLTLDDLDWQRGEIIVRGKGSRQDRLPMPRDVGVAVVDYLRYVRPASPTRRVFIRMQAPWHGFSSSASIGCLMRRALRRANLHPPFTGTHLLRHSLATDLLRRGASLHEIGQLLRHQLLKTTQIYAKVDIKALRGVAQSWMGGAR
jgi:integrase/recombinase XerD